MVQLTHSGPLGRNGVSFGPDVFAMIAGRIAEGIENENSKQDVVGTILSMQDALHVACHRCGEQWPIQLATPISRSYARHIYNLARTLTVAELTRELERRFNKEVVRCPRCGCGSGSDVNGAKR